MSVPDKAMGLFFRLITRWTVSQVDEIEKDLNEGRIHPRDAKMRLAHEIVDIFHGEAAAIRAEEYFVRVFQQRDLPQEMPEYTLQAGQTVLDVLMEGQLIKTRGEGRRLFEQYGVRLDGETVTDPNLILPHPGVLQAGKRRFLRVISTH